MRLWTISPILITVITVITVCHVTQQHFLALSLTKNLFSSFEFFFLYLNSLKSVMKNSKSKISNIISATMNLVSAHNFVITTTLFLEATWCSIKCLVSDRYSVSAVSDRYSVSADTENLSIGIGSEVENWYRCIPNLDWCYPVYLLHVNSPWSRLQLSYDISSDIFIYSPILIWHILYSCLMCLHTLSSFVIPSYK